MFPQCLGTYTWFENLVRPFSLLISGHRPKSMSAITGTSLLVCSSVPYIPQGHRNYLTDSILNNITGLYTNNVSTPLNAQQGLRQFYEFGLYSYCAYIDEKSGTCGNHTAGQEFKPYDVITSDMLANYSRISASPIIPVDLTFKNSKYLGQTSNAAYWLILLGTISAALALITSVKAYFSTLRADICLSQWYCKKRPNIFCFFDFLRRWQHSLVGRS